MQHPSTTTARRAATGVVIDPQAPVSTHLTRRTRELLEARRVRVWSIDGMDARERRDLLAAGRRFPHPRLVRGTVGGHRCELSVDDFGVVVGRCDCEASRWGRLCCHLLALAVVAVAELGFEGA
jgi:hypothetical protein